MVYHLDMGRILGTIAAAALLIALAACGAPAAKADPVAAVKARECAVYARVRDQIRSATAHGTEVFELMSAMTAQGTPPWGSELSRAAKYADVPSVPLGGNPAREVAAALSNLALQIDDLDLDATASNLSGVPNIPSDWNRILDAQATVAAACG